MSRATRPERGVTAGLCERADARLDPGATCVKVYIRYLPPGVEIDVDKPYLSVATYPFPGAFAVLRNGARAQRSHQLTRR